MRKQKSIFAFFNKNEDLKTQKMPQKMPQKSKKIKNITKKLISRKIGFVEMDWFKNPKFAIEKDTKKLKIPPSAFKKMTPSVKRYFEIKSLFWDFIIFYKVGKFYEMYDNDAIICNRELGLNFMKGEKRSHVGIPEKVYAKNAAILVERGYKVVRVDQVETVREMAIRKKKKIGPTVVKRDITKISTPGASGGLNGNLANLKLDSKDSVYLLSIKEEETENKNSKIGICFVDSETSKVHFGEFEDDCHR
ncbi:DNA mismatch repair protein msh6 [Bonamia ostreae]|uniref:DNA mismatch repair protein msh6 n=1 Tax=Bonamia ostreae TaxID=126728 RepID=A0ABV2AIK6_9EUKA